MSYHDIERELAALKSCTSQQHGRHINTLPVEPPLSPNLHPVVVAGPSWAQREIQKLELLAFWLS